MKPFQSVYFKILLTILLCFALPLSAVFFYTYHSMENTIQQKIVQQAYSYLDRLSESVQETVNQISDTATYISTDWRINEQLVSYYPETVEQGTYDYSYQVPAHMSKYEFLNYSSDIQRQLSNYAANWLPDSAEISLLLNDGQFFCTWTSINTDFTVLTDILQKSNGDAYFTGFHASLIQYAGNKEQISVVRKIYNIHDSRQYLGTVIITIPTDVLKQLLINYQSGELFSYYIIDTNENVIASAVGEDALPETDRDLIERYNLLHMSSGQSATLNNVFIDSLSVEGPSWKLYLLTPYDSIFQELHELRQTTIGLGFCLILLLTIVTLLLSYRFLFPLRKLTASMYEIEQGNWDTPPLPIDSRDEIGSLTERFNHLIAQLHLMFDKIKESERQKSELKFEMLLAQINPHFLFNTLNSIKWMAMMIQADNIVGTIRSLARLLEISMNRQTDVIPIWAEVENLRSYLDIQSLRYSGMFSFSFDIDPRLNDLECLKLIFQPFVENAIFYNIQEDRPLNISISGKLEGHDVILEIIDNGKGMSEQQIQKVLSDDSPHEKSVFRGIGINNVRQRIQLKYGNSYGVFIESEPGNGLTVRIRFPAVLFSEEDAALTIEKRGMRDEE